MKNDQKIIIIILIGLVLAALLYLVIKIKGDRIPMQTLEPADSVEVIGIEEVLTSTPQASASISPTPSVSTISIISLIPKFMIKKNKLIAPRLMKSINRIL